MIGRIGRALGRLGITGLKHGSTIVAAPSYVPTYYILGF